MAWYGEVYVLTNHKNGKQYVGRTRKSGGVRWREHIASARAGSVYLLHKAIRKYGAGNFSVATLQRCRTSETLNRAERQWVKRLGTLAPNGYNLTLGGDGVSGFTFSSASKKKMSSSRRRWFESLSPEEKAAYPIKFQTSEFRGSQSERTKAQWAGKTSGAKLRAGVSTLKGCKRSEESRARMSTARKAAWADPQKRERYLQKARTRVVHFSDEGRARLSKSSRSRWAAMTDKERADFHARTWAARRAKEAAL